MDELVERVDDQDRVLGVVVSRRQMGLYRTVLAEGQRDDLVASSIATSCSPSGPTCAH
ncbi:hypothetical protein ACFVYG_21040 [Streptomyces sp. NPDC058256]|uniref:hypothetical protein n=1 Tax=Streptomyces sp. NPDC058256 TaxID=3346408 RepID=UPI0036E1B043